MSYDSNPEASWWYWPDPTVLANNNQRMFTDENTGLNLDDFTFMTCVDSVTVLDGCNLYFHGMEDINTLLAHGMWFDTFDLYGATSDDGNHPPITRYSLLPLHGWLANAKTLFGYSYEYKGAPLTNECYMYMRNVLTNVGTTSLVLTCEGPPFNSSYPIQVYGLPAAPLATHSVYGKTYWFAIYKKSMLVSTEYENVYNKNVMPYDLPDLVYYVDFSQTPAPTITPNIDILGIGDLGVHNWANVVHYRGEAEDTAILGHQFGVQLLGVQLPSSDILSHQFTVLKKTKRYRRLSFKDRIAFKRTI